MNIFHPISKLIFFSPWFIEEEIISIGTAIVIILDMVYFYRLFPHFGLDRRKALIPYYNWFLVYHKFWNRTAFFEHIAIEIFGLFWPLVTEHVDPSGSTLIAMGLIDLFICYLGLKHHWEINEKIYEHFDMDRKYLPLCLFFDASLLMLIRKLEEKQE